MSYSGQQRLRVMTVVGTRPEIIRLSRVTAKLDAHTDHVLIHTGQNYDHELNQIFFEDLELRMPDRFLGAAGATAAETIGQTIIAVDAALQDYRPDALLVLGDTNSCLAVIPAKRRRIPIFHMEAGNRCFDMRVPEEINRRIVDHTADINLTYSTIAREYLLREGLPPDRVIKTGSPMSEVLAHYRAKINASDILAKLELNDCGYFVVSAHREENIESDRNFGRLVDMLGSVAEHYGKAIIMSVHPRTRNRLRRDDVALHPLVQPLKPLSFSDYVRLQMGAQAVLSDSGTITEESSILNFPALNIREAHERPEGMEEGAVMMVGLSTDRAIQALELLATQPRGENRLLDLVADYRSQAVSDKVVRLIISYTDYVRRVVWREDT
jgi:UDP-N-acetylglucosamine 2-epimerase (non-hydrolysing)